MKTCGRCGAVDSIGTHVRMALVNVEREAHQDGKEHEGPQWDHGLRCVDKDACRARVKEEAR